MAVSAFYHGQMKEPLCYFQAIHVRLDADQYALPVVITLL